MNEEVVLLKKLNNSWIEIKNTLANYECAGVWLMEGKSNGDKWACLEVGETSNIKNEVGHDLIAIVSGVNTECSGEKTFRSFRRKSSGEPFSEVIKGKKDDSRYIAKYRQISKSNDEIKVTIVLQDDDISKRYKQEVKEAMTRRAKYWYPAPTNRNRCKISQWEEVRKYE